MVFKRLRRKLRSRKKELPPGHDGPSSDCPGGQACQHFDNNGKVHKIPRKLEQRLTNSLAPVPNKSVTNPYMPTPTQSQTTSRPIATLPPPSRSQTRPRVATILTTSPSQTTQPVVTVPTTSPSQITQPVVTVSTPSQSQITPTVAAEPPKSQPEITAPVTTAPTTSLPQITPLPAPVSTTSPVTTESTIKLPETDAPVTTVPITPLPKSTPLAPTVSTTSLASSESTIELPERFPPEPTVQETLPPKPSPPVTTASTTSQSPSIPKIVTEKELEAFAKKRGSFRAGNSVYVWDDVKKTYEEFAPPPRVAQPNSRPPPRRESQYDSGSITIEERIRFQRIALGMTDAQIQRALPPGHYTVQSRGTGLGDRPSGRGDLAYAYYAQ